MTARLTATHWGNYLVGRGADGAVFVNPTPQDHEPSPIGRSLADSQDARCRVARPAVRLGYYKHRRASDTTLRGREPFVEVSWEEAIDIVAEALTAARAAGGNRAIYAGSYGWASAGRFHHAQGQIHRFMQMFGGYTDSRDSYSLAAAEVLIPHVLGMSAYSAGMQSPSTREIAGHCRRIVFFGGAAARNMQVNPGGIGYHDAEAHFGALAQAGIDIVNISPIRDDVLASVAPRWIPCRPNSDVAIMLGMIHTLIAEQLYDRDFVDRYCTGFDRLADYLSGRSDGQVRNAAWAAALSEVPEQQIRELARLMARERCLVGVTFSLQRAEHGEQTYWAAWALGAALGHIGLPGGGVLMGAGVSKMNTMQRRYLPFSVGTIPQQPNPVKDFIPVARVTEMLERPGGTCAYNGRTLTFPQIDLVYWVGGNPFHHHQDINRLRRAWSRPKTIVTHEINWTTTARMADIVLPCTTPLEREDFAGGSMDHWLTPMRRALEPFGQARDDYAIFAELARKLGFAAQFTEGRDAQQWVEHLWEVTRKNAAAAGIALPDFQAFHAGPPLDLRPMLQDRVPVLERFRADPQAHPLRTPSGKIEIFSATIAGFGYADCLGHPAWYDKQEWLGSPRARRFPLHLMSNQPRTRLHSQLDHGITSQESKIHGREPMRVHPADAAERGIREGDVVRVFNDRGAFLAGVHLSDALRRGVVQISTGAWYDMLDPADPLSLEIHGNPNAVTHDVGTSSLAQGPSANSCLVQIERYPGALPPLSVFSPPPLMAEVPR
ncbi:MAG TPA: molybdopterin-dependent oxidoreductase [Steroidobacteraceae bacterium]|nr:molybdopterin-dependent oxidoreductase [Steroidobacteraceae bacterium]